MATLRGGAFEAAVAIARVDYLDLTSDKALKTRLYAIMASVESDAEHERPKR